MTSPAPQPSIADAARLMDALSFASSSADNATSSTAESHVGTTLESRRSQCSFEARGYKPDRGVLGLDHHQVASNTTSVRDYPLRIDASHRSSTTEPSILMSKRQIPALPLEIIHQIALQLLTSSDAVPISARSHPFPCDHASPPFSPLPLNRTSIATLLSLSSASLAFRRTLMPLIWHTIVVTTPQHLPRLLSLLSNYDTLSIRSTSPERSRRASSPGFQARLRHPLPFIRALVVSIPDKYIDLDQSFLLTLLRAMNLERSRQLEYLYWSGEVCPNAAVWGLVGPSLRSLEVDGRTFYHGHGGMGNLVRLECLRMCRYESTLLPLGARAVFEAQRIVDARGDEGLSEVPEGVEAEEKRNRGESPMDDLQRSTGDPLRLARHFHSHPPAIPSQSLQISETPRRTRITHLSLSSSKTSLLHQLPLITSLAFSSLTHLDIYPVTPEPPLSLALLTTSSTLTHLRLVLDVSGAFDNYNTLWSDLTGNMPLLQWLEVDPMPQQNTAPSFFDFVAQAEKLVWINGKEVDSYPPCFGQFDPGNPSGALPY